MRKIYALFLSLVFSLVLIRVNAQSADQEKALFNDAEYFLVTEDYSEALNAYMQLYRNHPANGNINYRIGLCLLNIEGQKYRSIPYLEAASLHVSEKYSDSQFSETSAPPQVLFLLGTAYQINNQLDLAISTFEEYKKYLKVKDVYEIDFVNKQIRSCEIAKSMMEHPVNLDHTHLDYIIPQDQANFNPVISANGNILLYMTEEKFYKAVWMVRKNGDTWNKPVNITAQLESDGDLFATSITADGNTLYLVRMTNFDGNIMVSKFQNGRWLKAQKLDKPVNTRNWETHAGISGDGKTLYFTSNRKGGLGGQDIYVSKLDDKEKWSNPVNLGPNINTAYNEATPFILEDNKTLYFSSQGHEGMGGFDIFRSVLHQDGTWSVPVNLGYPWNTTDDNTFLYPLDDGKRALYAGIMDKEEYKANIKELVYVPEPELTEREIQVYGYISYQDNNIPEAVPEFHLYDENGNEVNAGLEYNNPDQSFVFKVVPGRYEFVASVDNYVKKRERLEIDPDYNRDDLSLNLEMVPEKVSSGEYIVIKNILFDFDSFELGETAKMDLERLYSVMNRYPTLYIEVIGHTDSRGNPDYNFELSRKRSSAVINYLTEKGIDPARFINIAAGETGNIAMNTNPDGSDNPEGRQRNRNVSIRIPQSGDYNITVEPITVPDHLKPSDAKVYSILLTSSDHALDNSYFENLSQISSEGVTEHFLNSVYFYTLGTFYSMTQAEELLQSRFLSEYQNARVIDMKEELGQPGLISSLGVSGSENFSIQIGAYRDASNTVRYHNRDDFQTMKCDDGIYRIFYGRFSNKEEAIEALPEIKASGFEDAFVVDLEVLKRSRAAMEVSTGNIYVIQIKALNVPLGRNYFSGIKDVKVVQGPDGIYRYYYGGFESIEHAGSELERIKKLGYNDAFVRELNSIPEK